ncbi:MAG: helix-turn-helix domain-containing protein [Eubacteriales bacterium]|nr:helix-turn-helix domain-containing protein [Eubacteriales bacterium]
MLNTLKNLTGRLQRQIIRMLDITCTMVVGEVHMEKTVAESLDMKKCLEDKLYLGDSRIISYAVNSKLEYSDEELPRELWKQLEYELNNHVSDETETIRGIFDVMEEQRCSKKKVIENCRRMLGMMSEQNGTDVEKLEKLIGEYEIFEEFRGAVLELCHNRNISKSADRKEYSTMVARAVAYMEQNYTEDISLETCAHEIGSSYTYLNRAFKQETGMRFVEYLNQCRLKKAKSLLIRNSLSMKEIVEKAGFRNYNYFFKVFKENEGITPSEFAAKN